MNKTFANGLAILLALWQKAKDIFAPLWQIVKKRIQQNSLSLWQILFCILPLFVFFYYLVGGMPISTIDTSASVYKPSTEGNKSATADISIYLIRREVQDKLWTPNLPFLFPSYFLDNMPNFQQGLMSAISKTILALSHANLSQSTDNAANSLHLAAKLLQYPGNIWLFSPSNSLKPVPSSTTQYKKARKALKNFNLDFVNGNIAFDISAKNLVRILDPLSKDLYALSTKTESYIQENAKSFVDTKADDTFYFARGKLYAYELLFKALGLDFKQVLVQTETYARWTSIIKDLEMAADLNPSFIRNGKLNSSVTPNHLAIINYLNIKAYAELENVIQQLKDFSDNQNDH